MYSKQAKHVNSHCHSRKPTTPKITRDCPFHLLLSSSLFSSLYITSFHYFLFHFLITVSCHSLSLPRSQPEGLGSALSTKMNLVHFKYELLSIHTRAHNPKIWRGHAPPALAAVPWGLRRWYTLIQLVKQQANMQHQHHAIEQHKTYYIL